MNGKFEEKMNEAAEKLGLLCDMDVENSEAGVRAALELAFAKGSCRVKANAVLLAAAWQWAKCEADYHSASPSGLAK